MDTKTTEIKLKKEKNLFIDLDCAVLEDLEIIVLKRNGRVLSFPVWELWQTLERYSDCIGCDYW